MRQQIRRIVAYITTLSLMLPIGVFGKTRLEEHYERYDQIQQSLMTRAEPITTIDKKVEQLKQELRTDGTPQAQDLYKMVSVFDNRSVDPLLIQNFNNILAGLQDLLDQSEDYGSLISQASQLRAELEEARQSDESFSENGLLGRIDAFSTTLSQRKAQIQKQQEEQRKQQQWQQHHGLGIEHFNKKEYQNAIQEFEQASAILVRDDLYFLGVSYSNIGNNPKAIECFKKHLDLNPQDRDSTLYWLGALYCLVEDFNPARAALEQVNPNGLAQGGVQSDYYKWLGRAYYETGNLERALESARKSVELNPEYADAKALLEEIVAKQQETAERERKAEEERLAKEEAEKKKQQEIRQTGTSQDITKIEPFNTRFFALFGSGMFDKIIYDYQDGTATYRAELCPSINLQLFIEKALKQLDSQDLLLKYYLDLKARYSDLDYSVTDHPQWLGGSRTGHMGNILREINLDAAYFWNVFGVGLNLDYSILRTRLNIGEGYNYSGELNSQSGLLKLLVGHRDLKLSVFTGVRNEGTSTTEREGSLWGLSISGELSPSRRYGIFFRYNLEAIGFDEQHRMNGMDYIAEVGIIIPIKRDKVSLLVNANYTNSTDESPSTDEDWESNKFWLDLGLAFPLN